MKLEKSSRFSACPGPVVTIVLDGVGISPREDGDAVKTARTPMLDRLMANFPMTTLLAHGTAVGMPSDEDMGNSEVGHNAIGAGRVFAQGAKLVAESIASGHLWEGRAWHEVVITAKQGGTLHFIGLFSDGNVHSHIDHLKAMLEQARKEGVPKVRLHILLDGRDVGETSALDYVDPFEAYLEGLRGPGFDVAIASGGGRMTITMDRYEANWAMVQRGWDIHVRGEGRQFASAHDAIVAYRNELKVIDQDLPGFVIAKDGKPLGPIVDGDAVVFFNFRGDRAIEISRAFTEEHFTAFPRGPLPKVTYAGMMQSAIRDQRNAKIRPRHLFLERQPHRQIRRCAGNLRGNSERRGAVRTTPVDEVRRNHRRIDRRGSQRPVPVFAGQLRQRRHGRPYRQLRSGGDCDAGPGFAIGALDSGDSGSERHGDHHRRSRQRRRNVRTG
jgi:2,3-bisphosphoglycerate-independent phosphoglycerate mutase